MQQPATFPDQISTSIRAQVTRFKVSTLFDDSSTKRRSSLSHVFFCVIPPSIDPVHLPCADKKLQLSLRPAQETHDELQSRYQVEFVSRRGITNLNASIPLHVNAMPRAVRLSPRSLVGQKTSTTRNVYLCNDLAI